MHNACIGEMENTSSLPIMMIDVVFETYLLTYLLSFFLSLMKLWRGSLSALLVCRLMYMIPQGFWSSITKGWGLSGNVGAKTTFRGQGR